MTTPIFSDKPKPQRQPTHGPCPRCGFLAPLHHGRITWHFQIRVRRGKDGQPEEYLTQDPCPGLDELPEEVA